jgi:hypothetical protein
VARLITARRAAPAGGAGALIDGQAATITGSGFGSGPTLRVFETFDNGSNGATYDGSLAAVGASRISTPNGGVTYTNNSPHSGLLCATASPNAAQEFKNIEYAMNSGNSMKHYVSGWLKCAGGSQGEVKLWEIHGTEPLVGNFAPGAGMAAGVSYYAREDQDYLFLEDYGANGISIPDEGGAGTWFRLEMFLQQNSVGGAADGTAIYRFNRNGALFNHVNFNTRTTTAKQWDLLAWMDGHTNAIAEGGSYLTFYTDEMYVSDGWKRVELSAAQTPGNGTLTVPQRITGWADGQIDYTVFRGALGSGTVWELVYDDTNTIIKTTQRTLT